jgi:hypothetical protein
LQKTFGFYLSCIWINIKMNEHVNRGFLDRFMGKYISREITFLDIHKKRKEILLNQYLESLEEKKKTQLNETKKHLYTSSIKNIFSSRHKELMEANGYNPADWEMQSTPYGVFFFNKSTNEWMNNLGVVAQSLEDLLDMVGESADNFADSGNSRIPQGDPPLPPLPEPTSALDYEVFAAYFSEISNWNDAPIDGFVIPYTTFGVVPMIPLSGTQYNGLRSPDGGSAQVDYNSFISLAETIPTSRRVVSTTFFWDEMSSYTYPKHLKYKQGSDGFTYENGRFLNIWSDNQYEECKNVLIDVLEEFDANGIDLPYFADDKENVDPVYGLQGYNSYWPFGSVECQQSNSPARFDGNGNPLSQMPFCFGATPIGLTCDARQIASIINDPRFNSYVNPQNGKSVAQSFLDYYKAISNQPNLASTAEQVLAKWAGVTHPGDFQGCGNDTTRPYSFFGPGPAISAAQSLDEIYIRAAWDGALHELANGHYATRMFTEAFAQVNRYSGSTYSNYENFPVGTTEGFFARDSNNQVTLSPQFTNISGGKPFYGNNGNIIFASFADANFQSGYVTNPTTDEERYTWRGYGQNPYQGPGNLVRYAEEQQSFNWFYKRAHKQLVDDVKWMRHMYRTMPDFWKVNTPWVSPRGLYTFDVGYWYEFMYHQLCHGCIYFAHFEESWNPTRIGLMNNVLNEWRTVSYNSKARPCSNSTGNINLPVDRLIMVDAVEGLLKSGGYLLNSGEYLWRLTFPASSITEGIINDGDPIMLGRIGNDSDIPATITINFFDQMNGRGAWVKRKIPTPPNYEILLP